MTIHHHLSLFIRIRLMKTKYFGDVLFFIVTLDNFGSIDLDMIYNSKLRLVHIYIYIYIYIYVYE